MQNFAVIQSLKYQVQKIGFQWNSCEKRDNSTWYERSDILYNPSLEQSLNWCNCWLHDYYTANSLRTVFATIPEACTIEASERSRILYLIWMAIYPVLYLNQLATDEIPNLTTPPDLVCRAQAAMREPYLWRTANMSWRTCVVVKQIQSNPIQFSEISG